MKPTFKVTHNCFAVIGVVIVLTAITQIAVAQNNCSSATYPAIFASSAIDEDITNVTVGAMNNPSVCGFLAPGVGSIASRYSNYTGAIAGPSASPGSLVPFSLTMTTCGGSYSNFFQIYVDWNRDSDFLDAGEQVYSQAAAVVGNQTTPAGSFFTVPITATIGTTRMRVVNVETTVLTTNYASTAYTWGETEDYCFTVIAAPPCSGTPNAGTASISTTTGCASLNFTLSTTGYSFGTGSTFQWQSSSSASGPWTNITGANSLSFTTTATTTTYYRLVTTCTNGGGTATSNAVSYTVTGNNCSCGAYPLNFASSTADEDISNVTVGTMNNSSTCATVAPGPGSVLNRYSNYTGSVTGPSAVQGSSVPFSLTMTTCGGNFNNFFQIYVDWNQDGDFADAGEQVYSQPTSANGNQTVTGTFIVPPLATVGITRMRVVVIEATASTTNYASTAYTFGETEDYCFTVLAAPPCSGTPNAGTASISTTTGCASLNFTLSSTGFSFGTGTAFQWQSASSSSGPWTNIAGANSISFTTSTSTTLYYRMVTNCSISGQSNFTNAVSYTVVDCQAADNPCGAISLPVGTICNSTVASNVLATATSGVPNPTCGSYAGGDIWFTFLAPPAGEISINTNTVAGGPTNMAAAIYTGSCTSLTELACDDNSGPGDMPAIVFTGLIPGGQYFIRVWEFGNDQFGSFNICLVNPSPNTDCQSAVQLCGDAQISGASSGSGTADLTTVNDGCLNGENQSNWFYSQVVSAGSYQFTINPLVATDDYDFAVWQFPAGTVDYCPPSSAPTRCSWSALQGATGLGNGATDLTEGAGGNKWVAPIAVNVGDVLVVVVDNFSSTTTPFTLDFTGTAGLSCNQLPIECNITGTFSACVGVSSQLIGSGTPAASNPWTSSNTAVATVSNTGLVTTIAAGVTTITYTASDGCQSSQVFTVVPSISFNVSPTNPPCTGVCNGSANVVVTGGVGPYTYSWTGPTAASGANPTNLCAGNYVVTVGGAGGCNTQSSFTLSAGGVPSAAGLPSSNPTLCRGSSINPVITISTSGATGIGVPSNLPAGVTASWSANTITISGTPTVDGVFNYSIPLTGGCGTASATGTITVNPPITLNITSTNPSCPSTCNGTANVTVTGGAAPYTYTWTGPSAASGANPNNLCVGIYNVTVSGGGCTSQSAAPIPTSCFEIQSILIDACNPGTTPENVGEMVFFQVGPTGLNPLSLGLTWANTGQPFNNLCSNTTFINNVNATITGGGSLEAAPPVLPPGANVVLITGNTATTSANLFTNLSSTLYVLFQCTQSSSAGHFANASSGSGTRTFTMNFGAGCSDQVSYNIENLIGNDGASVVYTPSGTPTYTNTSCNAPFLPPAAGTVILTSTVQDVQVTASTTSICSGGSATLTATGATSYAWTAAQGLSATTGATVTVNPTATTTYTVTGTSGTCVETAQVTITVTPQPSATIAYPAASFCTSVTAAQTPLITGTTGGTFSAPTGLTINTSTGAITPSTSAAGVYTVTYTIAATGACPLATATTTVTINQTPTFTSTPSNLTACSGPDVASASSPTFNPLAGSTPTLIPATSSMNWTNAQGQNGTGVTTINNPIPNNTCSPISVSYTITPVNNGCLGTPITFPFIYNPKPVSSFTISPNPICVGQTATVTYTGTACTTSTYTWQGLTAAGLTVLGSGIGPYSVTATNAGTFPIRVQSVLGGCTGQYSPFTNLVVNPNPTVTITGPNSICSGNQTALNLTSTPAGATFDWTQTPSPNVSGSSNGTGNSINQTLTATGTTAGSVQYAVTPTLNGCVGPPQNTSVAVNLIPRATFSVSAIYRCLPWSGTINITGTANALVTYSINGGATQSGTLSDSGALGISFATTPISVATTLTIQSITLSGCSATTAAAGDFWTLTVNPVTPSISGPSTVCAGGTANITFTGPPNAIITYSVTGVSPNPTITLDNTGQATLTTGAISANTTFTLTNVAGTGPLFPSPLNFGNCALTGPSQIITVVNSVTPTFNLGPYCQNSTPTLPTTSTNGVSGTWSPATISTSTVGTSSYTFTPTGSCASGPVQVPITINPLNTVTTPSTIPPVCPNTLITPITFATTGATGIGAVSGLPAGLTASWNANSIIISGTPTTPGTSNFTIALAGGCGPVSASGTITVNPLNTAGAPSSSPTLCLNSPLTPITIATTGATGIGSPTGLPAGVTATWTNNVITISGAPNGSITATTVFTYSIPLTGGCGSVNASGTITVTPPAPVTLSYGVPYCPAFNSVSPTNSWTGTGEYSATPSGLNINLGSGLVSLSLSTGGTYTVTFTPVGCAAATSATITIYDQLDWANLQSPPSATICQGQSLTVYGQLYNNTPEINTIGAGVAAQNVTAEIGYSASNTNPNTWTNWLPATFNPGGGGVNNDEYQATLSGLAPGTYYYAMRYRTYTCDWQYGGTSSSGGGFWNGTTNVSGLLEVNATPNAGIDNNLSVCATGSSVNLFTSLGSTAMQNGDWTGPSTLSGGYAGTFNPASNAAGAYTYTVGANGCPNDQAVVTVTVGTAPTASVVYPTPICTNQTGAVSPTILGAAGGTFTAPSELSIQTTGGAINASSSTVGNYTVTYFIAEANGCASFQTTTNVSIVAAPSIPTLIPNPACANSTAFTAGGGTWYEFLVNNVSQGPPSATETLSAGTGFDAGTQVCVRNYPAPPIMDGALTDAAWGSEIAGSTGGASSSFGANRIDGLKLLNRNGILYGAVAGTEEDGNTQALNNRIALFIDCRTGGINTISSWSNKSGAATNTSGITNLNNGIVFDAGFEADYILSMNRFNGQTFFDLYNIEANTNNFLGSTPSTQFGFQANAVEGDLTKGFEFSFPLSALDNPTGVLKVFGMLFNDPGAGTTTISNQFITPANVGENSYGSGAVFFNNAAPNPVLYQLTQDCFQQTCVTVQTTVTPTFDSIPPLCSGDPVPGLPLTSINGVSGFWTPAVVNNTTSGSYLFTPTSGACAGTATLNVTVNPRPTIDGIFHE